MGDHLVAPALDAEAVHIVASEQGAQVGTDLLEIESESRDLVPVEGDLGLRLVVFEVGVRVDEDAAGKGCLHEFFGGLEQLAWFGSRGDNELHREVASTRQGGRGGRDHPDAGDGGCFLIEIKGDGFASLVPIFPWLGTNPSESSVGPDNLEGVACLRQRGHGVVEKVLVEQGLVDRGEG